MPDNTVPADVEGLSMLQHFDYPEEWNYNGNAEFSDSAKFGKGCVYFPDTTSSVSVTNTTGMFNLHPEANYEFEAFVKLNDTLTAKTAELEAQGYMFFRGHTFKYYSSAVTWPNAKTACENLGGHLATSTSAEKNTFLTTVTTNTVWLGGIDEETEGSWKWITGETWSYSNWSDGEPSGGEPYLDFNHHSTGKWNDETATKTHSYICEWDYDMRLPDANILSLGGLSLAQKIAEREVLDTTTNWAAQGYKFYEGHTFKYYSTALTWKNAKTACENLGGHLATSTSAGKNTFLHSLISANIWLGATDEASEGTWKWVTGEAWNYTNWESSANEPNDTNGTQNYLEMFYYKNAPGVVCPSKWNDDVISSTWGYICEWDYDIRNTNEPYSALGLTSANWGIDAATTTELTPNVWHHLLLRICGQYITLFVDGTQALSEAITGSDTLTPEVVTLGGYVGYMDEFAFRRNAGSGVPTVPTTAYGAEIVPIEVPATTTNNAPVSRAAWNCENLPEGLTLSSAGVLSGHPTTAGTYECEFSVATNWGTATKTVRIVVA